MKILDGKAVAQALKESLKTGVEKFRQDTGRVPHLSVILVGEDPASQVYVKNKHLACEKVGMKSTVITLPKNLSERELLSQVEKLNKQSDVDGILVQMPLPPQIRSEKVLEILSPDKDADGFTTTSLGKLWAGLPGVAPCTPSGVIKILEHYHIPIAGKHAVVVGRSLIVGKPMGQLLLAKDATVTLCHSKTPNLRYHTQRGDIVVVAAGKPEFMGKDDFKKDAVVIDVGIHGSGTGKLCGDVRFAELEGWVSAATPVPGGVGPMTIACLLENTLVLAQLREGRK